MHPPAFALVGWTICLASRRRLAPLQHDGCSTVCSRHAVQCQQRSSGAPWPGKHSGQDGFDTVSTAADMRSHTLWCRQVLGSTSTAAGTHCAVSSEGAVVYAAAEGAQQPEPSVSCSSRVCGQNGSNALLRWWCWRRYVDASMQAFVLCCRRWGLCSCCRHARPAGSVGVSNKEY